MILVNYTSLDALLPDFAEASLLQKIPTGKVQTLSRLADDKQRTAQNDEAAAAILLARQCPGTEQRH